VTEKKVRNRSTGRYVTRNFVIYAGHLMLLGWWNRGFSCRLVV